MDEININEWFELDFNLSACKSMTDEDILMCAQGIESESDEEGAGRRVCC